MSYPNQLAWHETLELHELVAFQANGLIKLKNQLECTGSSTSIVIY